MSLAEFAVGNTLTSVRSDYPDVIAEIEAYLSWFSKTAPYDRRYKAYQRDKEAARREHRKPRGWNGVVSLYEKKDECFPAGLLPRLTTHLKSMGHKVKIQDKREIPEKHPALIGARFKKEDVEARDWQQEAFEAYQDNERGVFEAATGAGKTTLVARIVADLQRPILILVNSNTLKNQMLGRLKELIEFPKGNQPIGEIGDGIWRPGLITVATYQTLYDTYKNSPKETTDWLGQFSALLIDEAHHAKAETYYALTHATLNCYYRYGCSATPFKNDKETEYRLVGVCGEIIYSYKLLDSINDGHALPPHIYMLDCGFKKLPYDDETGFTKGTFAQEYKAGIVEHIERNHLFANIVELLVDHKVPTLVLMRQKAQSKALSRLIDGSEILDGSSSTAQRESGKRRLASGELPVIIGSTIFNEGEDVPAIGGLCIAGGYKAEHLAIQELGRALRPYKNQRHVLVFDSWDSHGSRLLRHSKSRKKAWENEGLVVHVVTIDELGELMEKEDFWP